MLTDKQIARAVKDGKAVSVTLPDGSQRTGWVYGVDDYHWGLVGSDGRISLVHKSAPCVDVLDMVLDAQPPWLQEIVEPLVSPFRDYVMREHFKTAPATT